MPTIYPGGGTPPTSLPMLLTAKALLHPVRLFLQITQLLTFWAARYRQRRALARLDARLLRDIGITHYDAKREAEKPFWQD